MKKVITPYSWKPVQPRKIVMGVVASYIISTKPPLQSYFCLNQSSTLSTCTPPNVTSFSGGIGVFYSPNMSILFLALFCKRSLNCQANRLIMDDCWGSWPQQGSRSKYMWVIILSSGRPWVREKHCYVPDTAYTTYESLFPRDYDCSSSDLEKEDRCTYTR